jgi:hypothetical protein
MINGKKLSRRIQIKMFKVDKKLVILIKICLKKYNHKLLIFLKKIYLQLEISKKWNQMVFINKCTFITSSLKKHLFTTKKTCQYILAKFIPFHIQQPYNKLDKILNKIYNQVLNRIKNMKLTNKHNLKIKICFRT